MNSVLIASGGPKRDIVTNYEEVDYLFQEDGESPANTFNKLLNRQSNYDYVVYLSPEYNFSSEDSLSILLEESFNFNEAGAFYTDIDVLINGKRLLTKFNPSYNSDFYKKRTILNVPYIVKSTSLPRFTEEVENLYLWDGFLRLMQEVLIIHLPIPIFSARQIDINFDIEEEKNIVYNAHY